MLVDENDSKTAGLKKKINLCKGARVMLRKNVDQMKGLVNGAMGTLIDMKFKYEEVLKLIIKFDNVSEVTEVDRTVIKFQVCENAFVHRSQFPITLAYAITIHKSQGLSLECVIADLGNTIFTSGMTYVALSRVKTLQGLYLLNFDATKAYACKEAIHEYNRLRETFRPDLPINKTKF